MAAHAHPPTKTRCPHVHYFSIMGLMVVTLLGNSLTAGKIGIAYEKYLKLPGEYKIINRGRDGDTIKGLSSRLDEVLREDGPEILLIQSGANDILIPEMAERGGKWEAFVHDMQKRGSIPTYSGDEFSSACNELYNKASSWGINRVITVTIPPIGENLESPRNKKRENYNSLIRDAADNNAVEIADVAGAFEKRLSEHQPGSDWFFSQPNDFAADIRRIHRDGTALSISEERGLFLTMDGAHLNEHGAKLMGQVIRRSILKQ